MLSQLHELAQGKVTLSMSTLRASFASPFGRKARIAVSVLGLDDKVKVEPATTQDESVRQQNPLGKVPVLVLDDGSAIYDSPVILEYLDHLAGGGKILPKDFDARLAALKLQALADGLMDASILIVYEGRYRPAEKHEQKWLELQQGKIDRALAALEASPPGLDTPPTVGQITLACALGYREFRFPGTLEKSCPRLVGWLADFAARVPSFDATKPPAG
jgi:glutathione S-transferase